MSWGTSQASITGLAVCAKRRVSLPARERAMSRSTITAMLATAMITKPKAISLLTRPMLAQICAKSNCMASFLCDEFAQVRILKGMRTTLKVEIGFP
jgi:hypothetical protein